MLRRIFRLLLITALIYSGVLNGWRYAAHAQQKPGKGSIQFDPSSKASAPVDTFRSIESGPGLLVCAPASTDADLAALGAGVGTWLQYALTASPALGKMPMLSEIHGKRLALHKTSLRLTVAEAIDLGKRLGVTHFLHGEISGSAQSAALSYRLYSINGTAMGGPITLAGATDALVAGLPKLARQVAAALGAADFALPAAPVLNAKQIALLGRFDWTPMPDSTMADIKSLVDLGAKDPLAAVIALRFRFYLSDQQLAACALEIDANAAKNPLLLAEAVLTTALPIPPRKDAITRLQQQYPRSYIANLVYARLLRSEANTESELKATERAVQCAIGNPQPWLSLGHVYEDLSSNLRRARTAGDITEEEWKTLGILYARWFNAINHAVERDDSSAHAWYRLALAGTFAGQKEAAYEGVDNALERDPSHYETYSWGMEMFQPKWFDDEKRLLRLVESLLKADFDSGQDAAAMCDYFHDHGLPTAPLADRFLARQKTLMKNNPERPRYIYSLALFYEGTDRLEEAAAYYEKLLDMGATKEEYFGKALYCWQRSGKQERADALMKRRPALKLAGAPAPVLTVQPLLPTSPADLLRLKIQEIDQQVQQLTSQGKYTEAENACREWIKLDPTSINGYVSLAGLFRTMNKPEKARSTLKEAARLDKTDAGASIYFFALSLTDQTAEAADIAKLVADKQKTQPQFYANLGQAFLAKGELEQARKMAGLGAEVLKNDSGAAALAPDIYLLQGDILAKQGKKSDAEIEWKKAAFATTGNSPAIKTAMKRLTSGLPVVSPQKTEQSLVLFGRAQNDVSTNPQAALLEIEEAIRLSGNDSLNFRELLAECLAKTGKREEAVKVMQAVMKLDPDDGALLGYYNMLRDMGRLKDAIDAVKISHKNRKTPSLYLQVLQLLQQSNRLSEGEAIANMAVEAVEKYGLFPSDTCAAYTYKGEILMLQGKPKEAEVVLEKVLHVPVKDAYWTERARVDLAQHTSAKGVGDKSEPAQAAAQTEAPAPAEPNPAAARVHEEKSREFSKTRDYTAAVRELREAVRLDPRNGYYHYELSQLLNLQGLKTEEIAELIIAARVANDDWYCYNVYVALDAAGKPEEAIAEAKKGVLKPTRRTVQLYVVLGRHYLDKGLVEDALKMQDYGFEIQKGQNRVEWFDNDLYLLKGDILLKQDNKADARAAWQKAADYQNKGYAAVKDAQMRLDANP